MHDEEFFGQFWDGSTTETDEVPCFVPLASYKLEQIFTVYTYSLLSCVQPNCSPCSLMFILTKCGEARVRLCVLYHIGTGNTLEEALYQGQVGHFRLARAPAWKPSQHGLRELIICLQ
jgi:hypothetical protein